MDGLLDEILRVTEIVKEYRDPIMKGAGNLAAILMEADIAAARASITNGDIIAMLQSYHKLKEYEN